MDSKRRIFNILGIIFALLLFFILSIPTLVSTDSGKERLIASINQKIPGSVSIESVSLSWFGSQNLKGFSLKDPSNSEILTFESFTTQTPLYQLLFSKSIAIEKSQIQSLNMSIDQRLQNSLGKNNISMQMPDLPIRLSNVSTNRGSIKGTTSHNGTEGSFAITMEHDQDRYRLKGNIDHLPTEILDYAAKVLYPTLSGKLKPLLGDEINIVFEKEDAPAWTRGVVKMRSPYLQLDAKGKSDGQTLFFDEPVKLSMTLTPSAFTSGDWKLTKPAQVDFELLKGEIPLQFLSDVILDARLKSTEIQLANKDGSASSIKNFQASIHAPKESESFRVQTTGSINHSGKDLPFSYHAKHRKPAYTQELVKSLVQPAELEFNLHSIRTAQLDSLFKTGKSFQNAFGKTLSLKLHANENNLKGVSAAIVSDQVEIPDLSLTFDGDMNVGQDLALQEMRGTLKADHVIFKKRPDHNRIKDLRVNWILGAGFKNIHIDFTAKSQGLLEGKVDARFNGSSLPDIKANVEGNQLSTDFLTLLTGKKEWGPLFGPEINLNLQMNIKKREGPIKLSVTGSTGFVKLDGSVVNGVIQLNSPAVLQAKASQELGQEILSDFAPVFAQLISAEAPLRLVIDKENFSIPINLDIASMSFHRATLDLGKMTFRNKGDVKRLLGVLKAGNYTEASVWTTPLYLSMKNGLMNFYRMDLLLVEKYPLATWGKIDLASDRVNMVLGLSGSALSSGFGIQGLNQDYMLQVPIKGSTTNTKIDSSKTMTRIASIMAQSSGGPEGLVLGTVFDIANGKEPKVPAPTTNPLPWKDLLISENEQTSGKTTKRDPLKGIQKEASKFIKGIFK